MSTPLRTWYLMTRSCGHAEPVRVAGPKVHRPRTLQALAQDPCSHCAGWPTRAVDASVIAFDIRTGH